MPTPLVTAQQDFDWEAHPQGAAEDLGDLLEALGGAGDHGVGGEGDVHQEGPQAADVRHHALPRPQLEDLPVRPLPRRRATRAASSSSTRSPRRSCTRPSSSPTSSGGSTRPKSSASGPPSATSSTMSTRGATSSSTALHQAGWEISTTLHSYYKVLMNTDVSVNTSDQPLPAPSRKKSHIAYDAESGSDDDEGGRKLAAGGTMTPSPSVTTFTPPQKPPKVTTAPPACRRRAPRRREHGPPRRGRRRLRRAGDFVAFDPAGFPAPMRGGGAGTPGGAGCGGCRAAAPRAAARRG